MWTGIKSHGSEFALISKIMTDPETLYRQLGRLIETMPNLAQYPVPPDVHAWVGRAYALVQEVGNKMNAGLLSIATSNLGTTASQRGANDITAIVYRALAIAERKAPTAAAGAFIPVGNSFDAFAALSKLLQTATKDVLIVDPYMDEVVLTNFGVAVPAGVRFRLLADHIDHKATLQPAANRWVEQYGATRPLAVRLAHAKTLHDRAIFIDKKNAWTITQSLKDFAKRSPAEIVRADDTADLKIAAYEALWETASVVV